MDNRIYLHKKDDETPIQKGDRLRQEALDAAEAAAAAEGKAPAEPQQAQERSSSDELLGRYGKLKSEEDQRAFLEEHDLQAETWDELVDELETRDVKTQKAEAVTQSAVVGVSGIAPAIQDAESIAAEMQAFYDGKHGSLGSPVNQRKLRELKQKLDAIDPPVQVR